MEAEKVVAIVVMVTLLVLLAVMASVRLWWDDCADALPSGSFSPQEPRRVPPPGAAHSSHSGGGQA